MPATIRFRIRVCRPARLSFASPVRMFVQEEGVKSLGTSAVRSAAIAASVFVLCGAFAIAQGPSSSNRDPNADVTMSAVRDLQEQVQQLRAMVDEMRAENAQSRTEMQQLRRELQTTRSLLPVESSARSTVAGQPSYGSALQGSAPYQPAPRSDTPALNDQSSGQAPAGLEERVQKLEESTSLLGSKVDEQYGTKVESASKYRTRLSGIVLMNAFHNNGAANNIDFPDFARPVPPGSPFATVGATLRQSEIGMEIFGPNLGGAKTSANIQMDFAGGFAATGNGVNFGIVRLQTASLHFDWEHTSVIAGQDSLFISPLSPTSFATLAIPTFAYGGNLWAWTPQFRVERRFNLSEQQTLTLQAGVLDNLDWEFPPDAFYRASPHAGEQSGQPAYAARTAWSRRVFDRPLSFGVAGYYGRQDWTWGRYIDAWTGMADWQIPLLPRLTLSGEFYRGRGIGGLGAAVGRSIVFGGKPGPFTPIRAVNDMGGWAQLKFQLTSKLEMNAAFGDDDASTSNIRGFATDDNNFGPILGRNRAGLGNLVFRPRSDLLFAAEFRRLRSFPVYNSSTTVNQINLAMGILF